MNREPIIYDAELEVHFGDLDPFGHVSASKYLDYVITSRWLFSERNLKFTLADLLNEGIGTFITHSQMKYRKPIKGTQRIRVQSYVSEIKVGSVVVVTFKITTPDLNTLYCEGFFEILVVNLKTEQPVPWPEWGNKYIFHDVANV